MSHETRLHAVLSPYSEIDQRTAVPNWRQLGRKKAVHLDVFQELSSGFSIGLKGKKKELRKNGARCKHEKGKELKTCSKDKKRLRNGHHDKYYMLVKVLPVTAPGLPIQVLTQIAEGR